jgi:hypothetical protein
MTILLATFATACLTVGLALATWVAGVGPDGDALDVSLSQRRDS